MLISLNRVRAADVSLAGGKGANLGELIAAGFPVPDGFCITAEAYRSAVAPLQADLTALLEATTRRCGRWSLTLPSRTA